MTSNIDVFKLGGKLGLSKKDVKNVISARNNKNSRSCDTFDQKEIYKAGTIYGTINQKEIYKAGTIYGTINPKDVR